MGWVVNTTPRPLYLRARNPVLIVIRHMHMYLEYIIIYYITVLLILMSNKTLILICAYVH